MNVNVNQSTDDEGRKIIDRDLQRRAEILSRKAGVILVRVLAMGALHGLPRVDQDYRMKEIRHIFEAEEQGIDPFLFREGIADSGLPFFQKEKFVRIDSVLQQMYDAQYVLRDMHWQLHPRKGPVNTFGFYRLRKGETFEGELRPPPEAWRILSTLRFNDCSVWANPQKTADGSGWYRLDTINVAKGFDTQEACRWLVMDGKEYSLATRPATRRR